MNDKQGFTLVELIGVITILGILITVISISVTKIIKSNQKKTFEMSIKEMIKTSDSLTTENGLATNYKCIIGSDRDTMNCEGYTQNIKNTQIYGYIKATDMDHDNTTICLNNEKFHVSGTISDYTIIDLPDDSSKLTGALKCENTSGASVVMASSDETYKAVIYLDPTNIKNECTKSNLISNSENKSGCMKWYVYDDSGDKYKMILDHNTTETVAWNSTGNNSSMGEVATKLSSDTTGWIGSPRLITADEIAHITGADVSLLWSSTLNNYNPPVLGTNIAWFYLDGAFGSDNIWETPVSSSTSLSKYYWLYDYTKECKTYGCKIENNNNSGYWTSSKVAGGTYLAWFVNRVGSLGCLDVNNNLRNGVRPVIEILKADL